MMEKLLSSAPGVCVITVTAWPNRANSSAIDPLTVSIPPMLGAKEWEEIRIFKRLRVISPNGAQQFLAISELRFCPGIGATPAGQENCF